MTTSSQTASGNQHLSALPGEPRTVASRVLTEPSSQEAAQYELALVKAEILDIQSQLARRKSLSNEWDPGYRHWKGAAIAALRAKEARHTFLKNWVRQRLVVADRRERNDFVKGMFCEIIAVLEQSDDAELALARLIAWRDEWLNGSGEDQ